jgi:hypothetical protein
LADGRTRRTRLRGAFDKLVWSGFYGVRMVILVVVTPEQALRAFEELPLSRREFQTIYGNVTPYMRW